MLDMGWKHSTRASRLVALILVLSACGRLPPEKGPVPVVSAKAGGGRLAPAPGGAPTINWDAPLVGGVTVSAAQARVQGGLSFAPRVPRFPGPPVRAQVSSASTPASQRTLIYIYRFPLSADFPVDGRVIVSEEPTKMTVADLQGIVDHPPGPASDFHMTSVRRKPALLVTGNGVGRLLWIDSGVLLDVSGPAISPPVVQRLAALVA